jgi:hypothetical protein
MAKFLFLALTLSVAGGIAFLAFTRVPAPTKIVEKPVPTERFVQ